MHKDTLIAAVYAQREATLRRVATLPDTAWDLPCPIPPAPPGVVRLEPSVRRVRDLVAHLITVDEMVLRGGAVRSWMNLRRLGSSGTWDPRRIQPLSDTTVTELVTLLARRGERFARMAAAAPAAVGHLPLRGPFGREPLLHVVARRVVHEWLHERDRAAAQGMVARDPEPVVAEVIADAVLCGLPTLALPQLRLDRGVVRLRIDLGPRGSGEAAQQIWSVDFARRQYGPRVTATPDSTVTVSAATLGLLAAHRVTLTDPDLGIRVEGARELGDALLAAITLPSGHDGASQPARELAAS